MAALACRRHTSPTAGLLLNSLTPGPPPPSIFLVPSKRNALDSLLPVDDEALPREEAIDLSFSMVCS